MGILSLSLCQSLSGAVYTFHVPVYTKVDRSRYKHGSVFNFYQPDYAPTGAISDNGIVSPESQLLDPPSYISYLNGISGLIDFGLDVCSRGWQRNGFGSGPSGAGSGGSP